ncbi:MAG: hypothetical protein HYY37_03145 [Candidatus Aenigmarchaeota archaeon]|nr:hypothetical protein [Candidatus Aenigmarchaeota archaeon]
MRLKLIDEKAGSPFREYPGIGRQYHEDPEAMRYFWSSLLPVLGLGTDIKSLEIGPGRNQQPSRALQELGASVYALGHWSEKWCTRMPQVNDYHAFLTERGEERYGVPVLAGTPDSMQYYLGDVEKLHYPESELKDKFFDLVFFWGSIWSLGFSKGVEYETRSSRGDAKLGKALLPAIDHVKDGGRLVVVSNCLSYAEGVDDVSSIDYMNRRHVDLALYLASECDRWPMDIGFVGLSKRAVARMLMRRHDPAFLRSIGYPEERIDGERRDMRYEIQHHLYTIPLTGSLQATNSRSSEKRMATAA